MKTKTRFQFTQKNLEALPVHSREALAANAEYSDMGVKGLKLQVTKLGNKSFYFRYVFRGRKCCVRLGSFPAFSVSEARKIALGMRYQVETGVNPQAEKIEKQEELTLDEFFKEHYEPHIKTNLKSWKVPCNLFNNELLKIWGKKLLSDLTTKEIQNHLNKVKKRASGSTANRIRATLSSFYNRAIEWDFVKENPVLATKKFKESGARETYLNFDEIKAFLAKLREYPGEQSPALALSLLVCTGMRKSEAFLLEWDLNIDLPNKQIVLYGENTKSGKGRHIALNPIALDVLERAESLRLPNNPYVFTSRRNRKGCLTDAGKCMKWVKAELELDKNLRIHDLRHTYASSLVKSGATLFEVQKTLGHSDPSMTQRYSHLDGEDLQRVGDNAAKRILGGDENDEK